jgi:hypothetical protein
LSLYKTTQPQSYQHHNCSKDIIENNVLKGLPKVPKLLGGGGGRGYELLVVVMRERDNNTPFSFYALVGFKTLGSF